MFLMALSVLCILIGRSFVVVVDFFVPFVGKIWETSTILSVPQNGKLVSWCFKPSQPHPKTGMFNIYIFFWGGGGGGG